MPKSKEYVSSSSESNDSETEEKSKKRTKKEKMDKNITSKKPKKEEPDDDEEKTWDLGNSKRVAVRDFKGKTFVDIREMYLDKSTAEMKPGRKGICLSIPQWKKLKEAADEIDKVVQTKC